MPFEDDLEEENGVATACGKVAPFSLLLELFVLPKCAWNVAQSECLKLGLSVPLIISLISAEATL
jgi:hypothetical protein